jgi:hypothetical protein
MLLSSYVSRESHIVSDSLQLPMGRIHCLFHQNSLNLLLISFDPFKIKSPTPWAMRIMGFLLLGADHV